MSDAAAGRRYHVREILGRGGFGTVYRAELVTDGGFGKVVALKVLHSSIEHRPDQVARLRDEARVLGLVRHRALVGADALIRLDGRWTLIMEYVPGVTAHEILKAERGFPPSVALTIVEEVADALETVWTTESEPGRPLHLLHRDIKPSNLQLTDMGDIKVLDFGVARADFGGRESDTRQVVYGSPPYLSPERLEAVDTPGGDVFALGITLAEMLTGLRAQPVVARPRLHEERIRALLDAVDAKVQDPALTDFLARMLAYAVEQRPSMAEVRTFVKALRKRHREPDIREWGKEVVPRVQAGRDVSTGELSGRALDESMEQPAQLGQLPGATQRTWEPEPMATFPPEADVPPPPPSPAPPPPQGAAEPPPRAAAPSMPPPVSVAPAPAPTSGGCLGWFRTVVAATLVSVSALGVAAGAALVVGTLVVGLACWASIAPISRGVCVSTVADIDALLDDAKGDRRAIKDSRRLTHALDGACRRGEIGMTDAIEVENRARDDLADGTWTKSDHQRLERLTNRTLR